MFPTLYLASHHGEIIVGGAELRRGGWTLGYGLGIRRDRQVRWPDFLHDGGGQRGVLRSRIYCRQGVLLVLYMKFFGTRYFRDLVPSFRPGYRSSCRFCHILHGQFDVCRDTGMISSRDMHQEQQVQAKGEKYQAGQEPVRFCFSWQGRQRSEVLFRGKTQPAGTGCLCDIHDFYCLVQDHIPVCLDHHQPVLLPLEHLFELFEQHFFPHLSIS